MHLMACIIVCKEWVGASLVWLELYSWSPTFIKATSCTNMSTKMSDDHINE